MLDKQYLPASILCTMLRALRTNSGSSLGFIVEMWDNQAGWLSLTFRKSSQRIPFQKDLWLMPPVRTYRSSEPSSRERVIPPCGLRGFISNSILGTSGTSDSLDILPSSHCRKQCKKRYLLFATLKYWQVKCYVSRSEGCSTKWSCLLLESAEWPNKDPAVPLATNCHRGVVGSSSPSNFHLNYHVELPPYSQSCEETTCIHGCTYEVACHLLMLPVSVQLHMQTRSAVKHICRTNTYSLGEILTLWSGHVSTWRDLNNWVLPCIYVQLEERKIF